MTASFSIAGVADILGSPPPSSRLTRNILPEHRHFFGGRSSLPFEDRRVPMTPRIGRTITENGLAERWRRYDEQYRAEARISRFWIAELENAVVYPPLGIISVGGSFLKETIRNSDQLKTIFPDTSPEVFRNAMAAADNRIRAAAPQPTLQVEGVSFLLGFGVFENYFNWTLRYTSRVGLYQCQEAPPRLVVPDLRKRYVGNTLEFFGVGREAVLPLTASTTFERLVLISPVALGRYEISPLIVDTLRGHPRLNGLWRRPKRKVYIPRRNVAMRQVTNEAEVEAALVKAGFEIFDNAENSVLEQARAFRDASVIVSPHGAGLSNVVFADPGTTVVEIVPEGYDQGVTSYRSLSDLFDLRYVQLFGREMVPDRKGNRCNSDIQVDIPELLEVLASIGD
jgi:hypothetical protein